MNLIEWLIFGVGVELIILAGILIVLPKENPQGVTRSQGMTQEEPQENEPQEDGE